MAEITSTQYSVEGRGPARPPQRVEYRIQEQHRHVTADAIALLGNA